MLQQPYTRRGLSKCVGKMANVSMWRLEDFQTNSQVNVLGIFGFLVYWFVNAFVCQIVKGFVHKNSKYALTDSLDKFSFGKLAIYQTTLPNHYVQMEFLAVHFRRTIEFLSKYHRNVHTFHK